MAGTHDGFLGPSLPVAGAACCSKPHITSLARRVAAVSRFDRASPPGYKLTGIPPHSSSTSKRTRAFLYGARRVQPIHDCGRQQSRTDDALRLSASVAYYTLLAIAPVVLGAT